MTSRFSTRLTVGVVAVVAFIGGLVVAAGFNLTPFGYAQQAGVGAKPPQAAIQEVNDASNAFVAIAEHVTPAVIKIDGTNFPTIGFGDDDKARVGEWVLAVGNPLGLDFTVTAGIISAKGRSGQLRNLYASQYAIVDYIQTDAAINPGNSGGPLVNSQGEVIGINSAIASGTGYYSGYGFAIPISLAKTVMNDLIQYGKVRRAILGVSISDLRPEDAQAAGLKEIRGALVGGGTPGQSSPAEQAGIEAGDVIVAIDRTPVDRVAQLQRVIRVHKPGETVSVDVMRYGQKHTYKVKLTEAPSESQVASGNESDDAADSAAAKPASYDKLGISVEPMTTDRA